MVTVIWTLGSACNSHIHIHIHMEIECFAAMCISYHSFLRVSLGPGSLHQPAGSNDKINALWALDQFSDSESAAGRGEGGVRSEILIVRGGEDSSATRIQFLDTITRDAGILDRDLFFLMEVVKSSLSLCRSGNGLGGFRVRVGAAQGSSPWDGRNIL